MTNPVITPERALANGVSASTLRAAARWNFEQADRARKAGRIEDTARFDNQAHVLAVVAQSVEGASW